jgi:hypothetical protein
VLDLSPSLLHSLLHIFTDRDLPLSHFQPLSCLIQQASTGKKASDPGLLPTRPRSSSTTSLHEIAVNHTEKKLSNTRLTYWTHRPIQRQWTCRLPRNQEKLVEAVEERRHCSWWRRH